MDGIFKKRTAQKGVFAIATQLFTFLRKQESRMVLYFVYYAEVFNEFERSISTSLHGSYTDYLANWNMLPIGNPVSDLTSPGINSEEERANRPTNYPTGEITICRHARRVANAMLLPEDSQP